MVKQIFTARKEKEPGEVELRARALARQAANEGFVLLKNEQNVLPVPVGKIALFGSGARMTVKGGTGSGEMHERYSVSIEEGMINAGYEITSQGWLDRFDKFYQDSYKKWHDGIEEMVKDIQNPMQALGMVLEDKFLYPTGVPVTEEDLKSAECDTAIYVIARQAGEGNDRHDIAGDYQLDELELGNIKAVAEYFKKTILVVNSGGVTDLKCMDENKIDGLIFIGQSGEEGGNAFADIVSGKVSPSGKLTDTWAYQLADYPSTEGFSDMGDTKEQYYKEGIYVGYRYFDSFHVSPRYPFGFGLSYTDFDIKVQETVVEQGKVKIRAAVTNMGDREGKEVVQCYVTVPFTEEGAEYQRLTAFHKTKSLKPQETEEAVLQFDLADMADYWQDNAVYQLNEGEYVIRIGNCSVQTQPTAVLVLSENVVTEYCENICPMKDEITELFPPVRIEEDLSDIPRISLELSQIPVVHHHYHALPMYPDQSVQKKIESMTVRQLATLVIGGGIRSRKIVQSMGACGSTTAELYESCGIPNITLADGPAGLNLTPRFIEDGEGNLKACDLYEQYNFGTFRAMMMAMMAKPEDGTLYYQYATAWPCSTVLAQTWNVDLMEEIGDAVGCEMEEFGVTIWLAPGMNTHRNPLCGRVFEYYSEDPYVSGCMAAALTNGVQKHSGKGVSIKHFCANNHEIDRDHSSSNMTERTLRQIYLKGFETALKRCKPETVMASYNKVNGTYCPANKDLLVKVLRNEWKFEGLVMSDWNAVEEGKADVREALAAHCNLIMPGLDTQPDELVAAVNAGELAEDDLRRSAARVLSLIRKNTMLESQ